MKKRYLILLTLLLSSCNIKTNIDAKSLDFDFQYVNYKKEAIVINDYQELQDNVMNYQDFNILNEEYFKNNDLVCLFVSSNAEEARNGIKCESIIKTKDNYTFTFQTKIQDEGTDLAYFINTFVYEVPKEYKIIEENIKIQIERKIINK